MLTEHSGSHLVVGLLAATALHGSMPAATAHASHARQLPSVTAKTTEVFLFNHTSCALTDRQIAMSSGTVTRRSPEHQVPPRGQSAWATGPSRWGNIAGTATFRTATCSTAADSGRLIKVGWKNPNVGKNSYTSAGTDNRFRVTHSGGAGISATVYVTVTHAS